MNTYEILEEKLCEFTGKKHCIAVSSGTAALLCAIESDRDCHHYAVPDVNMKAASYALSYAGKFQYPMPVDEITGNMLPVPSGKINACIFTDLYGRSAEDSALKSKGLIIQDAAESHGAPIYGDIVCYSFYKNKIVAGEEGGAVCTDDDEKAEFIRSYKCMGFGDENPFDHKLRRAFNFRMANLLAGPIIESLSNIKENLKKRRQVEQWYDKYIPEEFHTPHRDVVWVYDIKLPIETRSIVCQLQTMGIQARDCFVSEMDKYSAKKMCKFQPSKRMYFPVYPDMDEYEVLSISKSFDQIISRLL